jgi:hypothetical protein
VLPVALHPGRWPRQAQPLTAVLVLVMAWPPAVPGACWPDLQHEGEGGRCQFDGRAAVEAQPLQLAAVPVLPVALHPGRRPRQAQPLTAVLPVAPDAGRRPRQAQPLTAVLVLGVAAGRARRVLAGPAARR